MELKKFNQKLNGFIRSQKSQRDTLQELIEAALAHYDGNTETTEVGGDTGYLTVLVRKCVGVKSVPTRTVVDYIKEHANVIYTKLGDGEYGFKKAKKGDTVQVTMPEVTWYDWTGGDHNKPKKDYDWEASLNSLRGKIAKELENGTIKNPERAPEALAMLDSLFEQ